MRYRKYVRIQNCELRKDLPIFIHAKNTRSSAKRTMRVCPCPWRVPDRFLYFENIFLIFIYTARQNFQPKTGLGVLDIVKIVIRFVKSLITMVFECWIRIWALICEIPGGWSNKVLYYKFKYFMKFWSLKMQ